jgi:osmotically inducible lipoprotein OsmB
MQKTMLVLLAAMLFAFTGCANMTTTEQRVLSGGAIGAGSGIAIGSLAGAPAIGAAVGAGAGALGGLVYDQAQKSH